ncbi:MAG TPA: Rrf2 family transcriptional regulator [Fimbriimonadales bacterium]|nr:Rrf2 family transcriptional regulator [Fimbriimonadales bacterium]
MKFSTQEEYGLRCLLAIARVHPDRSLTIPEISKSEGLSEAHVAKLLMILRKHGFVKSTRGQSGGYMLSRSPNAIRVSEVLSALGGKLFENDFCEKHSGAQNICVHDSACKIRSLWARVQLAVDKVLYEITLADLFSPLSSENVERDNLIPISIRTSET